MHTDKGGGGTWDYDEDTLNVVLFMGAVEVLWM